MQLPLGLKVYPNIVNGIENAFDVIGYDVIDPGQAHCMRLGQAYLKAGVDLSARTRLAVYEPNKSYQTCTSLTSLNERLGYRH